MKQKRLYENEFVSKLKRKYGDKLWELNLHERELLGLLTISKIVINQTERCKGIGTKVMNDICNYADKNHYTITLSPSTVFGATSTQRLKKFYKTFGFIENKNGYKTERINETMYRLPKK